MIEAMHASIPKDARDPTCSNCKSDAVPCPFCYIAWWRKYRPYSAIGFIQRLREALTHER